MAFSSKIFINCILCTFIAVGCSSLDEEKQDASDSSQDNKDGDTSDIQDKFNKRSDFFDSTNDFQTITQPTLPASSNGSGGSTGLISDSYDFDGRTAKYAMYVPANPDSKPLSVIIYFHGDGGNSVNSGLIEKIGKNHNFIGIAMASPAEGSWWATLGPKNAEFIMSFFEDKVQKEYNVSNERLYFAGSSGGANFQSGMLLPLYSYKYPITSFNLCGGAKNILETYLFHDKVAARTQIYYIRATGDFLEEQIQESLDYYDDKGIGVLDKTLMDKKGHCSFDAYEEIKEYLPKI